MIHPLRTMEDYNADQKKRPPQREKGVVFVREIMRQKQGVPPFFVTYRLTK